MSRRRYLFDPPERFVAGTVGPLRHDPDVQFVKAFFRRPFRTPAGEMPDGGGRVTDVTGATVQYHPEAGPGPHDALHLFDRFIAEINDARAA